MEGGRWNSLKWLWAGAVGTKATATKAATRIGKKGCEDATHAAKTGRAPTLLFLSTPLLL